MANSPTIDPLKQGEKRVFIYVDGSCSGNPGEGGAGVIIKDANESIISQRKKYLGSVTNNIAEYQALILGLQEAKRLEAHEVEIYLDSELVARQINGQYRVRDSKLKNLEQEVRRLLVYFAHWEIRYIPREQNREADRLAREAAKNR